MAAKKKKNKDYSTIVQWKRGADKRGYLVLPGSAKPTVAPTRAILISGKGNYLELHADLITIGRDLDNNVVIKGCRTVSRKHARLVEKDKQWHIVDLGSTNGTFINGNPIPHHQPVALADGARLRIGREVRFLFHLPSEGLADSNG